MTVDERFEVFMTLRELKNKAELMEYVAYLEDVKLDYEMLKSRVISLNNFMETLF